MSETNGQDISSLVVSFLRRHTLTQQQMADLLGVDQKQISRWKHGRRPTHPVILALALEQADRNLAIAKLRAAATELEVPTAR